jgi:hypothetical protein
MRSCIPSTQRDEARRSDKATLYSELRMPTRLDVLLHTPHVLVEATGFPLVLVSITAEPSRDEFAQLLEAASNLLDRRRKFVAVIDARGAAPLRFDHALDASTWLEGEDGRLRRWCRGAAFVAPALQGREAGSVFLKVCPLHARATFTDVAAGLRWAVRIVSPPAQELPEVS